MRAQGMVGTMPGGASAASSAVRGAKEMRAEGMVHTMPGASMVVAISVFELHVPEARSLKEKRSVVKSLIERIQARHRVCVLESDFQDLHQRSEITLALLGHNQVDVDRVLERIR